MGLIKNENTKIKKAHNDNDYRFLGVYPHSPFFRPPKIFIPSFPILPPLMGALAFVEYPPFLFPQFYSLNVIYPHPHFLLSPQLPQAKSLFGGVPFVVVVPTGH